MPAIHPGWATDAVTSPRVRTGIVLGESTVRVGRPATVNVLPFGGGQHGSAGPHLLQAAGALAQMDGHQDHDTRLLEALATDPGLDATDRVWAATTLAWASGQLRSRGVQLLETVAADPTFTANGREWASRKLADLVDGSGFGR